MIKNESSNFIKNYQGIFIPIKTIRDLVLNVIYESHSYNNYARENLPCRRIGTADSRTIKNF